MDAAAYPYYERLSQNPEDAEALAVLWDFHGGRAEFQQLATLVEQTAGRRRDPRSSADLFYRAGELWAKNVGRADKAVGNYRRAFELDPSLLAAVEAARAIYMQLGNVRSAAQLLEKQLGQTADPLVRAILLREGAQIHGQLGDLGTQIAYLEELLGQSPDDWEILRELAAAYIARSQTPNGQPEDASNAARLLSSLAVSVGGDHGVAFAEASLDAFAGDEQAYAILHEAYGASGRLDELAIRQIAFVAANATSPYTPVIRRSLAEQYIGYGQVDDAIACLEPLINDDPSLARTLAGLYRQAGRTAELAALLESLAPETEPEQRIADLKDLAALYGQQGQRDAMLEALRGVLAIDSADLEALALVEDDLRAKGEWQSLREALADAVRAEHCPTEQRVPRLKEIAEISLQHLDDPQAAIDAYEELLDTAPGDPDSLAGLDRVYARLGRWDELARVLAQRADVETDARSRRDVLLRLADLHHEQTHDADAEREALSRYLDTGEGEASVVERLLALREAVDDAEGALAARLFLAEQASTEDAPRRWAEVAQARSALGDRIGAIQAWRTVLDRDPGSLDAWDALDNALAAAGQHNVRFATLLERAEPMAEGPARAAIHARASGAARAMGDPHAALAEAERAMAMVPGDEAMLDAFMDALEASGDRERLLTFVREQVAQSPEGPRRVSLLKRAAHAVGAVDPSAAVGVWEDVRATSRSVGLGDDSEAIEALMGLAELAGDGQRVAELLSDAAAATVDPESRRGLLTRKATLLATTLGQHEEALATLVEVAREVAPSDLATWASLEAMAASMERPELVQEAITQQAELEGDDDARTEHAARLVAFVESQGSDPEALRTALELQHKVDPGDLTIVERLAAIAEAEGRWAELVGYLDELAEVEGDDEELSKIAQRVAVLADEKLDDPERAWDVLVPLSEAGDIACLELLKQLATRRGFHARIVPILDDLAQRVADVGVKAELWSEVAQRKADFLSDPVGALEAQSAAILALPTDLTTFDRVDALAPLARRSDLVAASYRASLGVSSDPTTLHELAVRGLAALEASGGGDEALAFAFAAVALLPADDEILEATVRLARGSSRADELYVAFDRRKKAAQSDAERFGVMVRAAETAAAVFGDRDTAFQYLEQALSQATRKKPDEGLLTQLEDAVRRADPVHPEVGLVAGLVERYAALAEDNSEDVPANAAVLFRHAADLCDRELALGEQAFALLSRAVSVWPADGVNADLLESLATRLRRLPEVASLYQKLIDTAYDAATAKTLLRRRADLLAERLNKPDDALATYQRLAELAPKDLDVLKAWAALLTRLHRWRDLVPVIERELDAGGDKVSAYRRIAQLWEGRIGNNHEAKDTWKRLLKLSPDDAEGREALARLERRVSRSDDDLLEEVATADAHEVAEDGVEDDDEELEVAAILPVNTAEHTLPPVHALAADEAAAHAALEPHDELTPIPSGDDAVLLGLEEAPPAGDEDPLAKFFEEAPDDLELPPPSQSGSSPGDAMAAFLEATSDVSSAPKTPPPLHAPDDVDADELAAAAAAWDAVAPTGTALDEAVSPEDALASLDAFDEAESLEADFLDDEEAAMLEDEDDAPSLDDLAGSIRPTPMGMSMPPPPPLPSRPSNPPPFPPSRRRE